MFTPDSTSRGLFLPDYHRSGGPARLAVLSGQAPRAPPISVISSERSESRDRDRPGRFCLKRFRKGVIRQVSMLQPEESGVEIAGCRLQVAGCIYFG
jgi:hypothetical protein